MDIYEKLVKIGFTENMAKVYIELLKNPGYNGTQIFKNLELPRSTVYKSLEDLLEKEYIKLIPSTTDSKNYMPLNPAQIVKRLKIEYEYVFSNLGQELQEIYRPKEFLEVYNMNGVENIYYKINEMLDNAKRKVYMSGLIDESKLNFKEGINIQKENIWAPEEFLVIVDDEEILIARIMMNYSTAIYTRNDIILSKYLNK